MILNDKEFIIQNLDDPTQNIIYSDKEFNFAAYNVFP